MKRSIVVGLAALALAPLTVLPATAGPPRHYHTISSTHGYAYVTQLDDCLLGEAFVSSAIGKYASQPGPVNKQGLTGVYVRVTDTCAEPPSGDVSAQAGGGPGGVVVFEADGQNMAPLSVDPRLRWAAVRTVIPASATDHVDGVPGEPYAVDIVLEASWTGIGELEHTTVVTHANLQPDGVVNSTANDLRRVARAEVEVVVDGWSVTGTDPGQDTEGGSAVLEQSKSRCIEVPRPGVEGFSPCFGFPG